MATFHTLYDQSSCSSHSTKELLGVTKYVNSCHFDPILKVFDHLLTLNLEFGKILNLLWQKNKLLGMFVLQMAKY